MNTDQTQKAARVVRFVAAYPSTEREEIGISLQIGVTTKGVRREGHEERQEVGGRTQEAEVRVTGRRIRHQAGRMQKTDRIGHGFTLMGGLRKEKRSELATDLHR
jgi:hypothetical protein